MARVLETVLESVAAGPKQESLSFAFQEQPPPLRASSGEPTTPPPNEIPKSAELLPAGVLFNAVREVLKRELSTAKTEAEIATMLDVSKNQAKAWLTKLVKEGQLEKTARPVHYRTAGVAVRLL
jgi:hypothetical protein